MWALSAQTPVTNTSALQDTHAVHQDNLHAIVSCLAVSKTWRHLANDNSVWRAFFTSRWSNTSQLASSLNFNYLYRQRYELDRRWNALSRDGPPNFTLWEPKRSQMVGHHDRCHILSSLHHYVSHSFPASTVWSSVVLRLERIMSSQVLAIAP